MPEHIKNNKEFQLLMFIDVMNNRYLSPKEIEFRIPSEFKDDKLLELVLAIRNQKSEPVYPLIDQQKCPFRYWKTPRLEKMLHEIDIQKACWQEAKQSSLFAELLTRSLLDEAFYSSWIEGAKTTRRSKRTDVSQ